MLRLPNFFFSKSSLSLFLKIQALLVLHQLDSIDLWNPDAPVETFWEIRYMHPYFLIQLKF